MNAGRRLPRRVVGALVVLAALGLTACQPDSCELPEGGDGPLYAADVAQGAVPDCPPPPPCDGCGGGTGEPHVVTFDQRRYDLQTAAEVVAARNPDGTFEVQWRQEPYGSAPVASITAVAMRVGGIRISVVGDGEVVRLDGEVAEIAVGDTLVLPTGVMVHRLDGQVVVVHEGSGAAVHVQLHPRVMGVLVDPPDADVGEMEGLLGDADGDPTNDLVDADGATIAEATWEAVHRELAEAWRVVDDTTLFDYDDGAGPDTYWDPTFPPARVTLDDFTPEQQAEAEVVCRAAGVTDPGLLAECTFDVLVTGDASIAETYARQQLAMGLALGDGLGGTEDEPSVDVDADAVQWATVLAGRNQPQWTVVTDDVVLVQMDVQGERTGTLVGLDRETGEQVWEVEGVDRNVEVVVAGDLVVTVAERNGPLAGPDGAAALVGIDLRTGEVLDDVRYDPAEGERAIETLSTLAATDGAIVYGSHGRIRGFDADDLSLAWEAELPDGFAFALVAGVGETAGLVWTGWRDDAELVVVTLDAGSGEVVAEGRVAGRATFATSTVAIDGGLVLLTSDGEVDTWRRLDLQADRIEIGWSADLDEEERPTERLAANDDVVVGYTDGDVVSAFDLADGDRLWDATTTSFNNNHGEVAIDADGNVYVASFGGAFLEAIAADGSELWRLEPDALATSGSPGSAGALRADDRILVAMSQLAEGVLVVAVPTGPR